MANTRRPSPLLLSKDTIFHCTEQLDSPYIESWESPRPAPSVPSPSYSMSISPDHEHETSVFDDTPSSESLVDLDPHNPTPRGRQRERKFSGLFARRSKSAHSANAKSPTANSFTTTASSSSSSRRRSSFGKIFSGFSGKRSNNNNNNFYNPDSDAPPLPSPTFVSFAHASLPTSQSSSLRPSCDRPDTPSSKALDTPSSRTLDTPKQQQQQSQPSLLKRVTRAASAPDLKQLASYSNSSLSKRDKVFVVDKSAPPVPAQLPLPKTLPPITTAIFSPVSMGSPADSASIRLDTSSDADVSRCTSAPSSAISKEQDKSSPQREPESSSKSQVASEQRTPVSGRPSSATDSVDSSFSNQPLNTMSSSLFGNGNGGSHGFVLTESASEASIYSFNEGSSRLSKFAGHSSTSASATMADQSDKSISSSSRQHVDSSISNNSHKHRPSDDNRSNIINNSNSNSNITRNVPDLSIRTSSTPSWLSGLSKTASTYHSPLFTTHSEASSPNLPTKPLPDSQQDYHELQYNLIPRTNNNHNNNIPTPTAASINLSDTRGTYPSATHYDAAAVAKHPPPLISPEDDDDLSLEAESDTDSSDIDTNAFTASPRVPETPTVASNLPDLNTEEEIESRKVSSRVLPNPVGGAFGETDNEESSDNYSSESDDDDESFPNLQHRQQQQQQQRPYKANVPVPAASDKFKHALPPPHQTTIPSSMASSPKSRPENSSVIADSDADEEDVPLGAQPGALQAHKSFRDKERQRKASKKGKSGESMSKVANPTAKQQQPVSPSPSSPTDPATENNNLQREKSASKSPSHSRTPSKQLEMQQQQLQQRQLLQLQQQQQQQQQLQHAIRNPFAFTPGELNRMVPKNGKPDPQLYPHQIAQEKAFEHVGHSLLPQTDEVVYRRRRRATTGSRRRPNKLEDGIMPSANVDDGHLDPPIAPFVHNSVLTCSEDESASETAANANTLSDDAPISSAAPVAPRPLHTEMLPFPSQKPYQSNNNNPSSAAEQQKRTRSQSFTNGVRRALSSNKTTTTVGGAPVPPGGNSSSTGPSATSNDRAGESQRSGERSNPTTLNRPNVPRLPAIDTKVGHNNNNNHHPSSPSIQPPPSSSAGPSMRLTVYVSSKSHVVQLELDGSENVKEIIEKVRSQGHLKRRDEISTEASSGGWALHECWTNFGIERPLRSIEKIADVVRSWTPGSDSAVLVLKRTSLAPLLSSKRVLNQAPRYGSYVHLELKKGKWSKRYVEFKNGNLYYAKDNQGKDETFLCSLATFDVFLVDQSGMRRIRPPRALAFSVKSLDPVTFFENKEDYMHNFSIKTIEERNQWFQVLLDARTFNMKPTAKSSESSGNGKSNRYVQSQGARDARGLIGEIPTEQTFVAGSLLSRVEQEDAMPVPIPTSPVALPDSRTWNRMTTDDRKAYIAAQMKSARAEGRTLIQFDSSTPSSPVVTAAPQQKHFLSSGSMKRPVTSSKASDYQDSGRHPPTLLSQLQMQKQTCSSPTTATRSRSKSVTRPQY